MCSTVLTSSLLKGASVAAASVEHYSVTGGDGSHVSAEDVAKRKHCAQANLEPGDNVKVLFHVGAQNLVDGTGSPHTDGLW